MRRIIPLTALLLVPAVAPPTASGEIDATAAQASQLNIHASLGERTLYVRLGDSVAAIFPVAVGKDNHPTPTGTFRIRRIVWNPRWVPPDSEWAKNKTAKPPGHPQNPMKLVKIFFQEPDYYIHGTGEFESVGSAASHGCLRMLPDEAAELAKWLMEHGGNPKPEGWFRRILRFRSREQVVNLQNPIVMSITQ